MEEREKLTRCERWLIDALVSLGREKSVRNVQVRELCERAQINRTTFYKHYQNFDEFLERVVERFISDMDAAAGGKNIFEGFLRGDARRTFEMCVEFMVGHSEFLMVMTGPNGYPGLRERITSTWAEMFDAALGSAGVHDLGGVNRDVLRSYVVAVMWAFLEHTLREKDVYAPCYLAGQYSSLLFGAALADAFSQSQGKA